MTEPASNPVPDVDAIRRRVEAIPDEPLTVKANYNLYFMVRGMYTGFPFADVPITGTISTHRQKEYAEFIAHAPADIRALLAALERAEAANAAAVGALEQAYDAYRSHAKRLGWYVPSYEEWQGYNADFAQKQAASADEPTGGERDE